MVPTYREAANIPALAERVRAALAGTGIEWELILADDDSGDGSEAVVAGLARHLPVRLETRRERPRDLSRSVLFAVPLARYDRIVVMDADLSHPPERIADLLRALDGEWDMVIGSRYAPGGLVDRAWSRWRLAGLPAGDAARAAARGLRRPDVGVLRLRPARSARSRQPAAHRLQGRTRAHGARAAAGSRKCPSISSTAAGERARWARASSSSSRATSGGCTHSRTAARLRVLCFALVGASGFAIDLACYLALQWAGVEHRLARFCSFWPAVTWNWLLNRRVTFRERPSQPPARQWAKFVTGNLVGLFVNVGCYVTLTSLVGVFDRHRVLALVAGVALGGIVNFLLATLYVYRRHAPDELGPAADAAP